MRWSHLQHRHSFSPSPYKTGFHSVMTDPRNKTESITVGFINYYLGHGNTRTNVILTSDGKLFPRQENGVVTYWAPSKPVNHRWCM